ncbi:DMT family transporter [Marinimicrococcus flavescens]|uniref:DMT family transporter n=1 Tax=Marinimicrococcus flavescens TaxID=3031815 RepID=A0AAP3XQ38_9PROT|nr:DMT family transporter [Marinimicrococcus flavescens]
MAVAAAPAGRDRPLLGIGLMCLAVLCLTVQDSTAKHLALSYPLGEVVWARYAFNLVFLLPLLAVAGHRAPWRSARPGLQMLRGVAMITATGLMFLSVSLLPLAETYAISFLAPLFVAGLAVPALGEKVTPRRWAAIALGFLGVLVVARPGTGILGPAALAPVAMAFFFAVYQLATRRLAAFDHPYTTMFFSAGIGTALTSLVLPSLFVLPAPGDWVLMGVMGLLGLAGQLAMIRAFAFGDASLIAPFVYTQILWAVAIGWSVFGDLPDAWTLAGAAIVVSGGLWLLRQQARGG